MSEGKLKEIMSLCKASVTVTINDHKGVYQSVEEYLSFGDTLEDIDPAVLKEMIKRDTIITVQAYPHTPIGFYKVWHYDLDVALHEILEVLEEDK